MNKFFGWNLLEIFPSSIRRISLHGPSLQHRHSKVQYLVDKVLTPRVGRLVDHIFSLVPCKWRLKNFSLVEDIVNLRFTVPTIKFMKIRQSLDKPCIGKYEVDYTLTSLKKITRNNDITISTHFTGLCVVCGAYAVKKCIMQSANVSRFMASFRDCNGNTIFSV